MKKIEFKTSINCANCVKKISPFLDEVAAINNWSVDTTNTDKILTIEGEAITAEQIIEVVEDAGFDISLKG